MKQIVLSALVLVGACAAAWGQGPPNTFPGNGNAGVGTTSPPYQFTMSGPAGANAQAAFISPSNYGMYLELGPSGEFAELAADPYGNFILNHYGVAPFVFVSVRAGAVPDTLVLEGGNVAIGKATPGAGYKLDVAGAIAATDIYVTSNALPDYVFDADYRNASLSEVAKYIVENHHLPGIPSAAEAEKSGLSVGNMQNKLLQKVEELTLHMIAADERNTRLEQQNRELLDRLARLEAEPRNGSKKK